MRYDLHTIYSATLAWWLKEHPNADAVELTHGRCLQIRIWKRGDAMGNWLFAGAQKLYWENEASQGFRNCDQGALAQAADDLGHVIVHVRLSRDERFFPTWAAFAQATGIAAL